MKKLILLFMSIFFVLGTAVAQESGENALVLEYISPDSNSVNFSVNYIQLSFNKDVTVTLPEGGIEVKNNETGESLKLTRLYEDPYMDKNVVMLMFEQISVEGKDGKDETIDQYISAPGTYSYTIPAGCIKSVDGDEFAEQTFSFTVSASLPIVSVTPDYNGTTQLDKIVLTFEKEIAEVKLPASGLVVVDFYYTPVANIKSEYTISDDKKSVTLELEAPITTPGNYFLDIYQGVFVGVDNSINEYRSFSFKVIDSTPSYTTSIKNGDRVKDLKSFEITFNNVNEVKLVEGAEKVYIFMPGGGDSEGTATLADNKITVTFDQDITEAGEYMIYIPEGMFTMDGVENEERMIEVTLYTFEIADLKVVKITPVEGAVEQIDMVVIEFNQNVTLSYDEDWQLISRDIRMTCGDKEYTLTYCPSNYNVSNKLEYLVNATWTGYAYESIPVTEAGTYTLNLADIVVDYAGEETIDEWGYPATTWHVKNHACEGTVTWTIGNDDTGIEAVTGENDYATIYDLTGRKVEDITKAGIYIVNGKKQIVK